MERVIDTTAGLDFDRATLSQLQDSDQPRTDTTHTVNPQSFQEFISHIPSGQLTEVALLLAQRMKDQAEAARRSNQSQNNMRALSGSPQGAQVGPRSITNSTATTLQGDLSSHGLAGYGQSERMLIQPPQLRYIVTPHPNQFGRSIKQSVGVPENIPYMAPGVYRQSIGGTMELETSFRSSGIRVVGEGAPNVERTHDGGGLVSSLRGVVGKVSRIFKEKK